VLPSTDLLRNGCANLTSVESRCRSLTTASRSSSPQPANQRARGSLREERACRCRAATRAVVAAVPRARPLNARRDPRRGQQGQLRQYRYGSALTSSGRSLTSRKRMGRRVRVTVAWTATTGQETFIGYRRLVEPPRRALCVRYQRAIQNCVRRSGCGFWQKATAQQHWAGGG
jgi:hypothetical protein